MKIWFLKKMYKENMVFKKDAKVCNIWVFLKDAKGKYCF